MSALTGGHCTFLRKQMGTSVPRSVTTTAARRCALRWTCTAPASVKNRCPSLEQLLRSVILAILRAVCLDMALLLARTAA